MPMDDLTGTMCARMWNCLEIDAKGTIRPCCEFEGSLTDQHQEELNVANHCIDEILECEDLKKLRYEMLAGQRPASCGKCWSIEHVGQSQSLRQWSNHTSRLDAKQLSTHAMPLEKLGLALGNICNLRCRICGPWASSLWASDEIRRLGKTQAIWEKSMLDQGAWPKKATGFWQDLGRHCSDIRDISFYGGEPFIDLKHLDTLRDAIDVTRWKDISVNYTTNGTIFPATHLDTLRKFRQVTIAISIDDIGERFEYQRKNARWDQVVENVNLFRAVPEFRIQINCSVNVFNALYLNEILQDFQTRWPDVPLQLPVVRLVHYHSILYAPADFKRTVESKLSIEKFNTATQSKLRNIIDLMRTHTSEPSYWEELRQNIVQIDKFRKEKLRLTHGELSNFLDL